MGSGASTLGDRSGGGAGAMASEAVTELWAAAGWAEQVSIDNFFQETSLSQADFDTAGFECNGMVSAGQARACLEGMEPGKLEAATRRLRAAVVTRPPRLGTGVTVRQADVESVRDYLTAGGDDRVVSILPTESGMGGVGKSILAAAVSRDSAVASQFTGGVYWLVLGAEAGLHRIVQLQATLAGALAPPGGAPPVFQDHKGGRAALRTLVEGRGPVLLIVDDVWHSAHVGAFNIGATILFTARDPAIGTILRAQSYVIPPLTQAEAAAILIVSAGNVSTSSAVQSIVEICGGVPLALSVVGAAAGQSLDGDWEKMKATLDKEQGGVTLPGYPCPSTVSCIHAAVSTLPGHMRERYLDLAVFEEDACITAGTAELLFCSADMGGQTAAEVMKGLAARRLVRGGLSEGFTLHDIQCAYVKAVCGDSLPARHGRLCRNYHARCSGDTGIPEDKPLDQGGINPLVWTRAPPPHGYMIGRLTYHLQGAGWVDARRHAVLDCEWMAHKMAACGLSSLIAEYEEPGAPPDLALIGQSLRLSFSVLQRHPRLLPSCLKASLHMHVRSHRTLDALLVQCTRLCTQHKVSLPLHSSSDVPGGALTRVLPGHDGPAVGIAAISEDRCVSAGIDGAGLVWSARSGMEDYALPKRHKGSVNAVAVDVDGGSVFTGGGDGMVVAWNLETGEELAVAVGHTAAVTALSFIPGSHDLLSSSKDKTVVRWSAADPKALRKMSEFASHTAVVAAVSHVKLPSQVEPLYLSGGYDGAGRLWNGRGEEVACYRMEGQAVVMAVLGMDGGMVAVGHGPVILLWNATSTSTDPVFTLAGHEDNVTGLVQQSNIPGRQLLISASWDKQIGVWDVHAGTHLLWLRGHQAAVWGLSIFKNTLYSSCADGSVRVWTVGAETLADPPSEPTRHHRGAVTAMARGPISEDGAMLILTGGEDERLCLFKVTPGGLVLVSSLGDLNSTVRTVAWAPDGKTAYAGCDDGTVQEVTMDGSRMSAKPYAGAETSVVGLWVDSTCKGRDTLVAVTDEGMVVVWVCGEGAAPRMTTHAIDDSVAIARSLAGRGAVFAVNETVCVKVLAPAGKAVPVELKSGTVMEAGQPGGVWALSVDPGGQCVLGGGSGERVVMWDQDGHATTLAVHEGSVYSIDCSEVDGRPICLSGGMDGSVIVTELYNPEPAVQSIISSPVQSTALCALPGGTVIVVGDQLGYIHAFILFR